MDFDINKVEINNIQESDVDEIVRIGLSTRELQVQSDSNVAYYYLPADLKAFIKSDDDIHLAARFDNKLIGYRLATYNRFLREGYLIDIVVKEEFRHSGVGQLLYKETIKELKRKNCQWIWALVHESNKKMMKFMEKQKFKKGRRFYFYHTIDF